MSSIFTKSDNFKSEYSAAVIKIDELTPVEGSDFLAKTLVEGIQIVVRRDAVKKGDIMLYASNETQLNEKFLSMNNLYEISCREKNANAEEVEAILKPYTDKKGDIDALRNEAKAVKSAMDGLTKKSAKLNKEVKKLIKEMESMDTESTAYAEKKMIVEDKKALADAAYKKALEKTTKYTQLKKDIEAMVKEGEPYVAEAKKHVGFFNKNGRVRALQLRGEYSFGFIFSAEELQKAFPNVTIKDIESYVGNEFDTIDGELFCKAYVPPVKAESNRRGEKKSKAQNRIKKFDRMIDGEFFFHYDTGQLQKNIHLFHPTDIVDISLKIHGTSVCIGKLKTKEPKKIAFYKRIVNKICEWANKEKMFVDYTIGYGNVTSSRTVIKNKTYNPEVGNGYYNVDIWSEWGNIIYPYLEDGMTVYGEIFGRLKGGKYIQKAYDYGCDDEVNKLMIYRITSTTSDGSKFEWEVPQVKEWTERVIEEMKKNDPNNPDIDRIHPIDILYHGTLADLYPEIDTENHWHENVLEAMKKDTEHFGMEKNEPLCTFNQVPREGVVLRKYGDPIKEAFKLKCSSFILKESIEYNSDNYVDIEVAEGNY